MFADPPPPGQGEERISHVGDPADPAIRPKRLRRVKLFGNGELNRLIADALRRAEKPLASSDIAASSAETKGFGRPSIHALTRRVRANLSYLLRNNRVVKNGDRLTARWSLTT
jgi:hypothetical protein